MRLVCLRTLITLGAAFWVVGCGADSAEEPSGDSAVGQAELDSLQAAVYQAFQELEQEHDVRLSDAEKRDAAARLRTMVEGATEGSVDSQTEALSHDGGVDGGGFGELGDALGGELSAPEQFGTTAGSSSDDFGTTAGSGNGSFGTSTGGTGGTFSGSQTTQQGSFGTSTGGIDLGLLPCRSYNTVTAFTEQNILGFQFGLDCVSAGSRPTLRWGSIGGGGPYELFTISTDLQTMFRAFDTGGGAESLFGIWETVVGGTSTVYRGPTLSAAGGVGILVGVVQSASGDVGILIAIVAP